MKHQFKLLIAVGLIVGIGLKAQDSTSLTLSLSDAQAYALEHNKTLKNANLEAALTEKKIWEIISSGLPQVEATVDYMTYFGYEIPFSFGSGGTGISDDVVQGIFADAAQQYPTANFATIQASSYIDQQIQANLPETTIKMSDQSTAKFQISQLIFSGQYFTGIQTAKIANKLMKLSVENSELDIKESVINSYYMILLTERSLEVIRKNIDNMNETLRQTNAIYEAGMAEKMDVDQLSVSVSMLQNTLKSTERNLEISYNMLRFLLGLDAKWEITLTDNLDQILKSFNFEALISPDFVLEENISYKLLNSQEELNKKMVETQKWNYAPTVSGFYVYNQKILTTGFDMTPNHLLGFNLSVPIFSSGQKKAQVDIAKIELEKVQNNKSLMMDQLQLQESQLRYNYNSALENYNLQKKNIEVAKSVLDNYQQKYEQGIMTSLDLTQANTNYLSAENSYVQALMSVLQARLSLDKINNKL